MLDFGIEAARSWTADSSSFALRHAPSHAFVEDEETQKSRNDNQAQLRQAGVLFRGFGMCIDTVYVCSVVIYDVFHRSAATSPYSNRLHECSCAPNHFPFARSKTSSSPLTSPLTMTSTSSAVYQGRRSLTARLAIKPFPLCFLTTTPLPATPTPKQIRRG